MTCAGKDAGVDASADVAVGPVVCAAGSVPCDNLCVSPADPNFGCGDPSCQPCAASQAAICDAGACVASSCPAGFADCDGVASNGCEVDTNDDSKNCGACGHDCRVSACDGSGECAPDVLLRPIDGVTGFAIDATNLYLLESIPDGRVLKMPKAGGDPVVLASGSFDPLDFAASTAYLYFADDSVPGGVMRVRKTGGPARVVLSEEVPNAIAADDAFLYFSSRADCGSIMKVAVSGGQRVLLAHTGDAVIELVVDATSVYWLLDAGTLMKVAKSGGAPVTLATGLGHQAGFVVDASGVYVIESSGDLVKMPLGGGQPVTLVAGPPNLGGLATGAGYVYFASGTSFSKFVVSRVSKSGGTITKVGASPSWGGLAVDSSFVYSVGQVVQRFAK